jgi:amino acid transporter
MMKKIIWTYGLIAGAITMVSIAIATIFHEQIGFDNGMYVGFSMMILAFSMIFVGLKKYRDQSEQQSLSFGKAFKIGFFITLIGSTIYVITWLFTYYNFLPDFTDKYSAYEIDKLKAAGASTAEIANKTKEMADFALMYKNPLINAGMTYMEIIWVGLLMSVFAALMLKKKKATI